MKWKFTIYQSIAHYFRKFLKFLFCWGIIILIFSLQSIYAQPIVLDLEYNSLIFLNSNRSVVVDKGSNGFSAGSVHRYNNLISKDGKTIYGLLTIKEIKNAEIRNFDDDITYGIPSRFQPNISVLTSEGGYILYLLQFFDTGTNEDIFIKNYGITGIDIDGNNNSNREFIEFGRYSSYTVNDPNSLEISTNSLTGRTRFLGSSGNLSGIAFDNSCSSIINFSNPTNSIIFVLGQTGQNVERKYSLQFGSTEGIFSNSFTSANPELVAVDDIGITLNSDKGGVAVRNVLENDFINGLPVIPSQISIEQIVPASNPGVTINTSTGDVSVSPGTPAGNYTLIYKICMDSNQLFECDSAQVKVTVLSADLSISISSLPNPIIAGESITYKITVTNNGPTYAQNVLVNDILPIGLSLIRTELSSGKWTGSTWNIGKMAVFTSETMSIVAQVNADFLGSIQNTSIVTSSTFDPNALNNNVVDLNEVAGTSDLSITQSESTVPIFAGQDIIYTIKLTNEGPSDALNVVVIDSLPVGLTYVRNSLSTGIWTYPQGTIGTLKNGASVILKIEAKVNSDFSGIISNTASINSSTHDSLKENNNSTLITTINQSADLSISRLVKKDTIIAGEVADYSLLITNNGPSDAQSIQINDNIPPEIQFAIYSIDDGLTWNSWNSFYSISSLKAGESKKINIVGTLISNAVKASEVLYSSLVSSSTPDFNLINNRESKRNIVDSRSDMFISLSGPSSIEAGEKITYSLSVINNGPSISSSIIINDALPPGILNAEYSINNGNSWENWNGSLNFSLFNSHGNCNILLRGDVSSGKTGNIVNTSSISASTFDPNNTNNSSSITTPIISEADIVLSMVEAISPILKGGTINYLISVLNKGPGDAPNVMITDNFDPGIIKDVFYLNGSSYVPWTGSLNIGNIICDSTKTIQIRGVITNSASDPIENTAEASSSINDPFPDNNSQTTRTFLNNEADLSVNSTGSLSINAGEKIQYSITVRITVQIRMLKMY
jgi:uncharacterized repeat protein (TIGR01451 family)